MSTILNIYYTEVISDPGDKIKKNNFILLFRN